MKDIIEKLGMDTNDYNRELYNISPEAVKVLVDQRNEMLEALIDIVWKFQSIVPTNTKYVKGYQDEFLKNYDVQIKALEKATGKSWEKIKELIK